MISRVASILRVIAGTPSGIGIAELGRSVGLPRSTVYRIVASLAEDGFVTMAKGRQGIQLGPEFGHLATAARRSLADVAHPFMERAAWAVNETVDLAVLQYNQVRFIDQVVGNQRLRAGVVVGEVFPVYCTANGKAMLASLAPAALVGVLSSTRLVRLTPHTVVRRQDLLKELAGARESGVAFDREEHTLQICAIGTAVRDARGVAAGAITIAAPSQRFYGREQELKDALLEARLDIELALGAELS